MTGLRAGSVSVEGLPSSDVPISLWLSCHGYEERSIAHLDLKPRAVRLISAGFEFPGTGDGTKAGERVSERRALLQSNGYETPVVDDRAFDGLIQAALRDADSGTEPLHVLADISSMNRTRIASTVLACASISGSCVLDLLYFPSTFESHKHEYEPLEAFGPVHDLVAGWPVEADLPVALLMSLGTEPRRAEGIVESVEPDILVLFQPTGDEPEFTSEIVTENRRVLEVGGQPVMFDVRDPVRTHGALLATVQRLAERARVVVVPLGPKIFAALATNVAVSVGPEIGVWKASAGRGVEPVDVRTSAQPVVVRLTFPT